MNIIGRNQWNSAKRSIWGGQILVTFSNTFMSSNLSLKLSYFKAHGLRCKCFPVAFAKEIRVLCISTKIHIFSWDLVIAFLLPSETQKALSLTRTHRGHISGSWYQQTVIKDVLAEKVTELLVHAVRWWMASCYPFCSPEFISRQEKWEKVI